MQAQVAMKAEADAAPLFEKAIAAARTPDDKLGAQTAFGYALLQAKKPQEAAAKFRAAAEGAPTDARPRVALATRCSSPAMPTARSPPPARPSSSIRPSAVALLRRRGAAEKG